MALAWPVNQHLSCTLKYCSVKYYILTALNASLQSIMRCTVRRVQVTRTLPHDRLTFTGSCRSCGESLDAPQDRTEKPHAPASS